MTIPNFISIARLLAVPVLVWALVDSRPGLAFLIFILAGLSDAVDGAIARRFNQQSALGAYLDPIADKALLITIFVGLGMLGELPTWLAIAVVSRDLLIMAAVVLSFMMGRPITVRPLLVSKLTTLAQLLLAGFALAEPVFHLPLAPFIDVLIGLTALLTAISATAYLLEWLRHMASGEMPTHREDESR
ncbi:MAG: CDP-alcohol phosphatidyltransferase family protein [Aurantimonas endophytica]|uniref:CDP-diacylglycerol--glycerol-3-phosphate 3-phosphatidyltransferase n=1 Tax=Aurantimonas endophytica TaxID=1522175 RepID=A0A7W6MMQ6_9HYPH|nr:CDP-alcohol phosphatidyltransferase family protein [Aurantimonas endophytica]MBB4001054.1 cardiolipin synthase [Aurantimonas endophytica]MCO6403290.1 CDP-alcohol phosphatidyltransferase family protein [Aurantimonas endophytica]